MSDDQRRDADASGAWRSYVLVAVLYGLGLAFFVHTRLQRPIVGLGNHDVAGIAYNADVLLRGGLPYVDTIELKGPGTFFLTAFAFSVFGRSAATLLGTAEVLVGLTSIAVGWAAAGIYADESPRDRWRAVAVSGLLFWLGAAHFQANYTTWMAAPYAWSLAAAVWALRTEDVRRSAALHGLAGLMACFAYLMKANAVTLALIVPLLWGIARWRKWPGATGWAWAWWTVGAVLGALPLLIFYGAHGEVRALLEGVFPFGKASRYGQREMDAPWWYVPYRVVLHLDAKLPIQTSMVAMVLAGVVARSFVLQDELGEGAAARKAREATWVALAMVMVMAVFSVVGGGLGGLRYYRHYAPQYLGVMSIAAAHPATWQWLVRRPRARFMEWVGVAGGIGLLILLGSNVAPYVGRGLAGVLSNGWHPTTDDQEVADYIARHSTPEDRIFVWGWRGWAVYFFADRQAPTPMYKGLGTITEFNRNGLFRKPKAERDLELDFVPGPHADELLRAFQTDPQPVFIVRARPFFPGMTNDPMAQFEELHEIWQQDYVLVRREGKLALYEQIDHRDARMVRRPGEGRRGRRERPSASTRLE